MPLGTVAAVQNLNKRVEKKKKKKQSALPKHCCRYSIYTVHTLCTVSKYSSGIGTFII